MSDGKAMPMTLIVKLASVVVHAQELLSPHGHTLDRVALDAVANDPEVRAWIATLGPLAPEPRHK